MNNILSNSPVPPGAEDGNIPCPVVYSCLHGGQYRFCYRTKEPCLGYEGRKVVRIPCQ